MKEETKNKLKKIAKVSGFAITFGFAVFGVLCAAMLISNGGKKDDIKTLDNSLVQNGVRAERNYKPNKLDGEEPHNYFDDYVEYFPDTIYYAGSVGPDNGHTVYIYDNNALPTGYYRFSISDVTGYSLRSLAFISQAGYLKTFDAHLTSTSKNWAQGDIISWKYYSDSSRSFQEYVYIDFSDYQYVSLCSRGNARLELVDTLDLPVGSSITFPESFSPLGLFGDSVTNNGGYVYLPNATGNELDIEITGLIFKYGGVVYDGIHIECVRALSMGYINDDGQLVKQGGANDYMWALSWIKFYQRYKGQSPQDGIVVVMAELKSVTDNANDMPVAFTGRTQWVNRSDRTIQIIDDLGTITGRYDGRYSDMTDKKLMEWVSSSFSVGNALGVMGNNSVFDIFTNAFDSVLPILSIAILPNITLGMLLFIPLIGAIIVIIIRVVKK